MADFGDFGVMVGRYFATLPTLTDSEPKELLLDASGRLIISGRYLEDSAHVSGDAGIFTMGVRNDADVVLTSADGDYSPFAVDQYGRLKVLADLDVDFDYVYAEDSAHVSGDLGSYMLAVRADTRPTNANTSAAGDYASLFVTADGELWVRDEDANTALSAIQTAVQILDNVVYAEDSAHVSGDAGSFILGVRNDSDATLTSADGDYSPIAVDEAGRIKVISSDVSGTEEFTTSDALADDGDGLVLVSGTWTDVASLAVPAGEARIYGWQFDCDHNAIGRLIIEDVVGIDTVVRVIKTRLNSTAMPGVDEHWSESGRVEVASGTNVVIKVQVKRRDSGAGSAQASGSVHVRVK